MAAAAAGNDAEWIDVSCHSSLPRYIPHHSLTLSLYRRCLNNIPLFSCCVIVSLCQPLTSTFNYTFVVLLRTTAYMLYRAYAIARLSVRWVNHRKTVEVRFSPYGRPISLVFVG